MRIKHFYDTETATFTYVVVDGSTSKCAVIDSVMDYDPFSGKMSTASLQKVMGYIESENLVVEWSLDTHIHADHLSGMHYIKEKYGCKSAIGSKISEVSEYWTKVFNVKPRLDGFDVLLKEGDTFKIGNLNVRVIHTPGHTPACSCYLVEEKHVFVGDTIFAPELGTARTDFPGGSAETMYDSIQKLFALGDDVKIYICHDYPESGQEPRPISTVGEQKIRNVLINTSISKAKYVETRNKRDEGKAVPRLLYPSIQFNMRAGAMPDPESNGKSYMKIPLSQASG